MSKEMNWAQFFKEAGLPVSIAKSYSITFEDNRISKDMLMDLNKEILMSMGITVMGDVINILKHAKKIHSHDGKRKDAAHTTKTVLVSNKRPPPPTAHSTTAGQAPTVSTTSTPATKKKLVSKYPRHDVVPDSPSPELSAPQHHHHHHHQIQQQQQQQQDVTYLVLEPGHEIRAQQDQQETEYYVESTEPLELSPAEVVLDAISDFPESYETSRYEAIKTKRPMTMYSDELEECTQPKQPRVIILPGERRDIFTTSGLQKAAKVYESGEEPEGKLTTDRSRRLLESAGLIPAKDKTAGNSVFSRLDYKPSITAQLSSSSSHPHPQSTVRMTTTTPPAVASSKTPPSAITTTTRRIIKLTKRPPGSALSSSSPTTTSSTKTTRSVTNTSPGRKVSTSSSPAEKVTRVKVTSSSSSSSGILAKRLISKDEPRTVSQRLGVRKRISSNPVAHRVKKESSGYLSLNTSSGGGGGGGRGAVGIKKRPLSARSGVFAYEGVATSSHRHEEQNSSHSRREEADSQEVKVQSSMVADEYEYQTQRQRDIRSRLELREMEKRSRRGGPLVGRLASHQVFRRLE